MNNQTVHSKIRSYRAVLMIGFVAGLTVLPCALLQRSAVAQRPDQPRLQSIAMPNGMAEPIATRLNLQYHDEVGVQITVDERPGGGLLVLAPPAMQQRILDDAQALRRQLTASQGDESVTTNNLHLIHVSWREIEDAFQTIGQGKLAITTSRNGERASFDIDLATSTQAFGKTHIEVDRRRNVVSMTGESGALSVWRKVVSALDKPVRVAGTRTHLIRLVHADIAPVQRLVLLLRSLEEEGSPAPVRRARPASHRGDVKFQTAVFQAGEGGAGNAETPSGDVQAADGDGGEEGGGVIGDTDIQIIPESGLIIIKGAQRDIDRIKDVIAEIEEQAKITQPEIEVRPLKHADSNAVADLLTQLYEDVLSARQGEVSITSLDAPNALLLIGRPEAVKAVEGLIEKIDQPIPETDRLRVFRLQHASARDAETTIREFFTNQPGENGDLRPALGNRVRISTDYRTNSLIVGASPRDLDEVSRLIEQLDVEKVASSSQIRIFPLRNARAEDLAPVLQEAITGEPEDNAGETTAASSTLSIVALGQSGNPVLDSGILSGAVITSDNNANAIIVRAPAGGMPLISELIRQLDQTPGIDSLVKVFTIKNGDATQLTTALQDLFGDDAATSGTSIGAGNQAGLPPLSAAESALTPLRFSTDIRTNSIIVSGSAEDLEVVESILLRLDSTGFAERITEVIWLKHQVAENIAFAIQDYVAQRGQSQTIIQQYQQGLGPYDLPDRDIIVVPEINTNSLLISVAPRLYEDVRGLIDRLDRRPPMVLIKTLIAEVSLDDGFEIGGEFGLQDSVLFDRGVAVTPEAAPLNAAGQAPIATGLYPSDPGFNFNNVGLPNNNAAGRSTLANRGVTSFGAAASQISNLGSGGFVFSAASESVNLFLRTLQTADRLQILSRPQIMTADNTEGFVQVGQKFPRPTEISTTQLGQTLIGIEDEDIGIILRVQPRVGADGLIAMAIDASRSGVNNTIGQNIGFDNNNNPIFVPAIDITTAQATITAFDGQTVVFGGLITKTRRNFSRRVPYLADLPLLGTFFKYEGEQETRTELLVVMTPKLVTGHEDLEYVKQAESSRMSWCLADVVEMHGDVGLSGGHGLWGPAMGPTIYPDVHPTVDVFPAADMPGGPRALPASAVIDPGLPPNNLSGIELGPGESIISHNEMLEGAQPTPAPSRWEAPIEVAPQQELPAPTPELPAPSNSIPAPVPMEDLPAPTSTSQRPRSTQAQPASASGKWFQFNGKLNR